MSKGSNRYIYQVNIPTREAIMALFETDDTIVSLKNIIRHFKLEGQDRISSCLSRIMAMVDDEQLVTYRRNSWRRNSESSFVEGHVQASRSGYGFLIPIDRSLDDIFLPEFEMQKVFSGDRVLVKPRVYKGKKEGKIIQVLERKHLTLVGRIIHMNNTYYLAPEDQRIGQDIYIPKRALNGAQVGQVVVLEVDVHPARGVQPEGHVIEVLGDMNDPHMEIEIAVRKFHVPHEFGQDVLDEANHLPVHVRKRDFQGRRDLTHLPFMTIDGEDARDYDDAVYAQMNKDAQTGKAYWTLWVAIADVSHYVKPDTPLDKEARHRGTSVYFPRKVIPMLPEVLSNGLCSLNPNVNRCALVCEMNISMQADSPGEVLSYEFYPAVIQSHYRATYTEVAAALDGQAEAIQSLGDQYEVAYNLYALYRVLLKSRQQRGAIDFETTETKIVCDDDGKIKEIVPLQRNEAHRLIEECMLVANVCAADFILQHKKLGLFRVHDQPSVDRVQVLRDFLALHSLSLEGGEQPQAKDYAKLLSSIKDHPNYAQIQMLCLRSMQQAQYRMDNVGHFGLSYEHYTHFTSPIRRYPDLTVHRVIKQTLKRRNYTPTLLDFDYPEGLTRQEKAKISWEELGLRMSAHERRADEASYDVVQWLKCFYMQDKVGEVFEGRVTGLTDFGVFVTLNDLYVEGLLHISTLGKDYFEFDAQQQRIYGQRSGVVIGLNDVLTVRIASVKLEARKIDFVLESPLLSKNKKMAAGSKTFKSKTTSKLANHAKKSVKVRSPKGSKVEMPHEYEYWAAAGSPKINMNQKEMSAVLTKTETRSPKVKPHQKSKITSVRSSDQSSKRTRAGSVKKHQVLDKSLSQARSKKQVVSLKEKSDKIESVVEVKKPSRKRRVRSKSRSKVPVLLTQGELKASKKKQRESSKKRVKRKKK